MTGSADPGLQSRAAPRRHFGSRSSKHGASSRRFRCAAARWGVSRAGCAPSTASTSTSMTGRCSVSSANRAAARRRCRASFSASSNRTRARCTSTARTCSPRLVRTCAPCARTSRSCSRIRTHRSTRGPPSAIRSPKGCAPTASAGNSARREWPKCSTLSVSTRPRPPFPARVQRRSAPAHRDRQGARRGTEVPRRRRTGVGARRLDPLADPQPAPGPSAAARLHDSVRLPRPRRRRAPLRPRRRDVPRRDRRGRTRDDVFHLPAHPYTKALLSSVPVPDPVGRDQRKRIILTGDVPSPANPPSGCRFHPRCPEVREALCPDVPTTLLTVDGTHRAACHYAVQPLAAGAAGETVS